jgi:hypothetical protein
MDVVPATVSQLQNPTTLQLGQLISSTEDGISVPGLLCLCSCTAALAAQNGCGCAATDFADIVQQDPFFHTGVAADSTPLQINSVIPNRFAYVNTELLDYGVQSTYTIDDKNTTQTVYTTTNMDSVGFSNSNTFSIPPAFTITLKNANMWTWTDTMETTKVNTLDHTMTAFLNSTTAACYSNVDIYLDTVYHTYVFVPDSSSTSACR